MKKLNILPLLLLITSCAFAKKDSDIKVGSVIKGLSAPNQDGVIINLDEHTKKHVTLVYFFPKADTPGCTSQACSLRDSFAVLTKKNVMVLGVSTDDQEDLKDFKAKYKVPFDFISDKKREWAKAFDVSLTLGFASRQSFLIQDQKIIWLDRSASTSEQALDILNFLKEKESLK